MARRKSEGERAAGRDLIEVLDLMMLRKDDGGELEIVELSDLEAGELGELRTEEAELAMVLSEQDVLDIAETIEPGPPRPCWSGRTCGPRRLAPPSGTPAASWSPADVSRFMPCLPRSKPTSRKEPDRPMAARRRRRTAAAVGGAVVVAHGVSRRGDRRDDRRDDRGDRRDDRRDRR